MKTLPTICGLGAALAFAGHAAAQTLPEAQFYAGAGFSGLAGGKALDDVDLGALVFKGGARFGRYAGVEAEAAFGLGDDDEGGVNVGLKHQYAAYAVAYAPILPNADLFARIGYGASRFVLDDYVTKTRPVTESLNLGVGGQYFFDERNGLRADYTHYDFSDSDLEADGLSLTFIRKF